jgi:peroxiredoxin
MAASLKQDYAKIVQAGAELVMISPDSREQHRQYATTLFGEELPYPFVPDRALDIARRYGLLREEEHHHDGFYYRSFWILNSDATITHKSVPWEGNADVEEYQKLFTLIGSEPGGWRATCGVGEAGKSNLS